MTRDGWRELVRSAHHNAPLLELLAELLAEQDAAKERLRRLGFGVCGMPWSDVIEEVAARANEEP
jgi:hypothetical protein